LHFEKEDIKMSVMLTTTNSIDGYKIKQYLGVVGGHGSFYPDDDASKSRAWNTAICSVRDAAERAEADAVIGLQITTGGSGEGCRYDKKGWIFVQGTTVKLEKINSEDK
jgi:uncharacterized protein YbjQ (UPF0145 family)